MCILSCMLGRSRCWLLRLFVWWKFMVLMVWILILSRVLLIWLIISGCCWWFLSWCVSIMLGRVSILLLVWFWSFFICIRMVSMCFICRFWKVFMILLCCSIIIRVVMVCGFRR